MGGPHRDQSLSLQHMIKLLGALMPVQQRPRSGWDGGFCETLALVAVGQGMHQLSNFRTVPGDVRRDFCMDLMANGRHTQGLQ